MLKLLGIIAVFTGAISASAFWWARQMNAPRAIDVGLLFGISTICALTAAGWLSARRLWLRTKLAQQLLAASGRKRGPKY